mgnify:CR=1 FL=1
MKILQVQFKNRNGHTLRGIVTLPDTEGKVPFVVHLHGFAGSCSGYKSMYTHLSRALAAQGIGSARFDFYGNGESDGEFEDMSFDGLHTDAQDIFAWAAEQPYVDSEKRLHCRFLRTGHPAPRPDPAVPGRRDVVRLRTACRRCCADRQGLHRHGGSVLQDGL